MPNSEKTVFVKNYPHFGPSTHKKLANGSFCQKRCRKQYTVFHRSEMSNPQATQPRQFHQPHRPRAPGLSNPTSFFTVSVVGNGSTETEAAPKRESKKITSVKPMATAEPFGKYVILGAATKEAVLPAPVATGSAFSINGTGGIFVVL